MNNIQVRPTSNLIISKCKASMYLSESTSTLEKILTKYYDMFPNSSKYTGYTSNITIGEFYNSIINKDSGNLSILGGLIKTKFLQVNLHQVKVVLAKVRVPLEEVLQKAVLLEKIIRKIPQKTK